MLSREGLYYLLVLTFIVGGATLRDVNLMFMLAGLMIGPLLVNWRLVVLSLRQLYVERQLPAQVFAGRPFRVEIVGENRRRHLGSWSVVVEDWIEPESETPAAPRGTRCRARALLPYVPARATAKGSYRVMLPHRGRYTFGPLQVSSRFPMGLVRASLKLKRPARLVVYPRIGVLAPEWLHMIEPSSVGRQPIHRRQGPIDGDYYGLREWRNGDSKRWIHWRTTAKLGRLAVRQFEQQHNQDLALVLDLWQPDVADDAALGRVELAVSLAATIVDDLTRRGSLRLMVAVAAAENGWWSATASPVFARQLFERLALVRAVAHGQLPEILDRVVANVQPGMQVVVVSTRASQLDEVCASRVFADRPRPQRELHRAVWLTVGGLQTTAMFQWT
jgi:uncharacterized protein (DUF58 family)